MIKIKRGDAFKIVAYAADNDDQELASSILKIIVKSMSKREKFAPLNPYVTANSKKEIKDLRKGIEKYGDDIVIIEKNSIDNKDTD